MLENKNILVRRAKPEDLYYIVLTEQDKENCPYILQWTIEEHEYSLANDANLVHFIVEEKKTGKSVGFVMVKGLKDKNDSLEIMRLAFSEKGKGYGRQMLQLLKEWAFVEKKANRLWLDVVEHNNRAKKLYASEGFQLEGLQREAIKIADSYESIYMMSILQREYLQG